MKIRRCILIRHVLAVIVALAALSWRVCADSALPQFGRDTVLVWKIANQGNANTFVVRIAHFLPNRFIEWESATTQGTVFMSNSAVSEAEIFVDSRLFEAGKDNKAVGMTTLWLSQRIYNELKSNNKVKLKIDSLPATMTVESFDEMTVTVNRSRQRIPVMKVKDSRGAERWFMDVEANPLMVKHIFRTFTQTLSSITTDRANTLRWIKGKKLNTPR